MKTEFNVNNI